MSTYNKKQDKELQQGQKRSDAVAEYFKKASAQLQQHDNNLQQERVDNIYSNLQQVSGPQPVYGAPEQTHDPVKETTGVSAPDFTNDIKTEAEANFNTANAEANASVNLQEKQQQAEQERRRKYEDMLSQSNNALYSFVSQAQSDIAREKQEAEEEAKRNRKTTIWTAGTELASAIANLVGVAGFGAANQQLPNVSQSWMAKADQDTKIRRQEMANLREKLNRAKSAYKEGKIASDKALFAYDEQVRQEKIAQAKAEREYQMDMLKIANDQQNKNRQFQLDLAKVSETARHNLESEAVSQQRANAYQSSINASNDYKKAATEVMKGKDESFDVSFSIVGEDGKTNSEKLTFKNPASYKETIMANRELLSAEDKEALELKLFGKTANSYTYQEVAPLVSKYPAIMEALRDAAKKDQQDTTTQQTLAANASNLDNIFPDPQ